MVTKRNMDVAQIGFPILDYDADGTDDPGSDMTVCIFNGPQWSGMSRTNRDITDLCDSDDIDYWGNIYRKLKAGRVINMGTITFSVDWDPNEAVEGSLYLAFKIAKDGMIIQVLVPKDGAETTGPIINIPVVPQVFRPMGEVLVDGEGARLAAELVFDIADDITITPAV